MATKPNFPGWRFYLLWVVINSIVMILTEFADFILIIGLAVAGPSASAWNSLEILLLVAKFSFFASAFLGIGQWLAIRPSSYRIVPLP